MREWSIITSNNHPSNPQQPIHSLLSTSKSLVDVPGPLIRCTLLLAMLKMAIDPLCLKMWEVLKWYTTRNGMLYTEEQRNTGWSPFPSRSSCLILVGPTTMFAQGDLETVCTIYTTKSTQIRWNDHPVSYFHGSLQLQRGAPLDWSMRFHHHHLRPQST